MKDTILRGALSAVHALTLGAFMFGTLIAPARAQEAQRPIHNPGYVMLSQFIQACHPKKLVKGKWVRDVAAEDDCAAPSPVTKDTISGTTPIVPEDEYIKRWPNSGKEGYDAIVAQNCELCNYAHEMIANLNTLDQLFIQSDLTYQELTDIYNSLPSSVRAKTRLMQASQAAQAGFLCILSAGIYCIAAAVGAVGNILTAEGSLQLQIANIKTSLATIVMARLNLYSNRVTLRLDGMWLKFAISSCKQLGFDTVSGLPDLGPIPNVAPELAKIKNY
ncbi:MAG TPA: hypothetical protein VHC20_02960 [Candidatus Paceibacterota bacterium]|nr:hypothetical protein [Candidatus Paceibacterota bacterium]